ncbi:hypothetical protein ACJX0J_025621 [Zea mays]
MFSLLCLFLNVFCVFHNMVCFPCYFWVLELGTATNYLLQITHVISHPFFSLNLHPIIYIHMDISLLLPSPIWASKACLGFPPSAESVFTTLTIGMECSEMSFWTCLSHRILESIEIFNLQHKNSNNHQNHATVLIIKPNPLIIASEKT